MAPQKVALVTAGTAGLGAAIAKNLAQDYRVVINYANNSERAEALIEELKQIPAEPSTESPHFEAVQADVGDRASIQKMVNEVVSKFGRLDLVVSNAGWTRITNFMNLEEGMPEEDWDKCFLYNVKAHLWLFHAAKEALEQADGAFITTGSMATIKVGGSSLAYNVTKAALAQLSRGLAAICGPNIRVNTVSPGLLLTEWGMKFPEAKREGFIQAAKLKRTPTVEDCAKAVRALAENMSMTGHNMLIECGASI